MEDEKGRLEIDSIKKEVGKQPLHPFHSITMEVVGQDTITKEVVGQDTITKVVVDQDTITKEMVRQDTITKEVIGYDTITKDLGRLYATKEGKVSLRRSSLDTKCIIQKALGIV